MNTLTEPNAFRIETALADPLEIERYGDTVAAHARGEIPDDRFTAIRLQMGAYGQRQTGVNMLRVKAPGGALDANQLDAIGEVASSYAEHPAAHVTTRESVQIHFIPLGKTPAAMQKLATANLTTREACSNTVRNITSCAMAGACPRERTDINRHVEGAVVHFLRNPLNQQLPRKFKISFSACESDCAQGMLHDLGVIATTKDGQPGFKLVAGGGLGHKPREAVTVDAFVPEAELLSAMEAVITLHNKHSDRTKRAKSRIKFLVERFGETGFVARYREEFAKSRDALAATPGPTGEWRTPQNDVPAPGPGAPRAVFAQRQPGLFTVPVSVPLGHIKVPQWHGLAKLLRDFSLEQLRTTQDQNLVIRDVPKSMVPSVIERIRAVGFDVPGDGDNVVACPGTWTCRLGITGSQEMGTLLVDKAPGLRVRVSGCHNGCAQPETGDIGLYGEGRRLHNKLVPHYQFYLGGNGMAGGRLARKGPSVPVGRAIAAVERVVAMYQGTRAGDERFFDWTHRQADAYFNELLADLVAVAPEQVASLLHDYGDAVDFKPAQLGGGECAGAAQVFIGASFFSAAHERRYRNAFLAQHKFGPALECATNDVRLIAQGINDLLNPAVSFKVKRTIDDLAELADALAAKAPDDLVTPLRAFAAELTAAAQPDATVDRGALFARTDAWVVRAAAFCAAKDPQLDLHGALPGDGRTTQPVVFQRRVVAAPALPVAAAQEADVYEPMYHG
ncbi:MAG: nitrite/sulfite reductase [Betaproteobacteria bacterium]